MLTRITRRWREVKRSEELVIRWHTFVMLKVASHLGLPASCFSLQYLDSLTRGFKDLTNIVIDRHCQSFPFLTSYIPKDQNLDQSRFNECVFISTV